MSAHDMNDRLARLAPTSSPDPVGLEAARAAVFDAARSHGPSDAPTQLHTRRGRAHGDAHVVDLDDDSLDDVVPLDVARRRRKHRSSVAAVAAGGVVVAAAAVVLSPVGPGILPASPERSCADRLTASINLPADSTFELSWHTVAQESWPDTDLALLVSDNSDLAGYCTETRAGDSSTRSSRTWSVPDVDLADDQVLPRGITTEVKSVAWGVAGPEVSAVDVLIEWTDDSRDSGMVGEARMTDDGYWSFFFSRRDHETGQVVPPDADITLMWRLADGTERSMSLDEAWPGVDATTPLAEARRQVCRSGLQPVLEEVRDGIGVTLLADGAARTVLCMQDAGPPYAQRFSSSGTSSVETPAAQEAIAVAGGGSGTAGALFGRAGEDVARVEVQTSGARFQAEVVDGYWVVWDTDLGTVDDLGPWQDATLRWYLTDGSLGGEGTVFE
ncbi:hypothetical protein [Isoptericola croceus]|uniref:hypothetical protein n=1 Tax=Isoptericola croceus TaxID=3031406 RepID=UPI0023F63C1A|nr:hypothetical protein [Isoptericola croceus]